MAFDSDCREGICGSCGLVINGRPPTPTARGGRRRASLHMRSFHDGDVIWSSRARADAFPVIKDLVVDRSAFDRIIQAGGYVLGSTPDAAPDAHTPPRCRRSETPTSRSPRHTCIGCGACVAACPNASGMLFMGAKITHLGLLPQGQPERDAPSVVKMVKQHDTRASAGCTNIGECAAACPKEIPIDVISRLNKDLRTAMRHGH